MSDNPLKKLRQKIDETAPRARLSKANHTMYLSEPQFSTFRTYCKFKGVKPSEMVDHLIQLWLDEVKNDMPLDIEVPKIGKID